ncbi:MAG: phosphoketolase family protein [Thermomicrobiales bacterium]
MFTASQRESHERYLRAANYLAVAQVYLQDNVLLERPLTFDDVKPRLLGHWGTCPGINLATMALNRLILAHDDADVMLVVGPGHGAPAPLAGNWLDGTMGDVYPGLGHTRAGLEQFVRGFSWPGGFASHLNPMVPGTIYEGGELGYSLATAFGAILDNPGLIAACIIGDGEAETGPIATAWHSPKIIDPAANGAVLPMLHLNGYKISNQTIFSAMSDGELTDLFTGYGWAPVIVDEPGLDGAHPLVDAVEQAYQAIRAIQQRFRAGERGHRPAWPMIVLRSPKGWTGPAEIDGVPITGTYRSHQVPAGKARTDAHHLAALDAWLRSYRPDELFSAEGAPAEDILAVCPSGDRRLGMNPASRGWTRLRALALPALGATALAIDGRGQTIASALQQGGRYLAEVFRHNDEAKNFRMVCPDETSSNQLGEVFAATGRAWAWPIPEAIAEDCILEPGGRVMEMLSEHTCQGWLQGYLQTGRHGLFPCYEAFIMVVESMVAQYAKWLKLCHETTWREPVASLNILLTSDAWRQDHNGYSHQGPGFINSLLQKKAEIARIYLPPDANTFVSALDHCLASRDYINLLVATKQPLPQWLSMDEAIAHMDRGASAWEWAGYGDQNKPDLVIASAGNIPTVEALAAAQILREEMPELSVRFVNVADLMVLASKIGHPHGLTDEQFIDLFTWNQPVIFAFHGYPSAVHQLIYNRPVPDRFKVRGYIEEGTTTTPFDMLIRNGASRWQLVITALECLPKRAVETAPVIWKYQEKLNEHRAWVETHGEDPREITDWRWAPRP